MLYNKNKKSLNNLDKSKFQCSVTVIKAATALIAIEKLHVTRGERDGGNQPSKCAAKALFDANFRHI